VFYFGGISSSPPRLSWNMYRMYEASQTRPPRHAYPCPRTRAGASKSVSQASVFPKELGTLPLKHRLLPGGAPFAPRQRTRLPAEKR